MILHYNRQQMRALARLVLGFDHSMASAVIEQANGIDVDALIDKAVRTWYLELLDNADATLLETETPATMAVSAGRTCGGTLLVLPENVRRVISIQHDGWECSTAVLPAASLDNVVKQQRNPFTAAGAFAPVAVEDPDCRHITAWPAATNGNCIVNAVIDHGDDAFAFDEAAIASLVEFLNSDKFKNYLP